MSDLRDISGYEGLYAVSCDGRVWRYPRTWKSGRNGSHTRSVDGAWLKSSSRGKYPAVCLTKDGREKTHDVHRLVARAWVPNPGGLPQVNHKNGDKGDPRAENLEWVTPGENARHSWAVGLSRVTEKMREHARALPRPERGSHCKQGHELTPENSIEKKGGGRGCRICQRAYHKVWKAKAARALTQEPTR